MRFSNVNILEMHQLNSWIFLQKLVELKIFEISLQHSVVLYLWKFFAEKERSNWWQKAVKRVSVSNVIRDVPTIKLSVNWNGCN